MNDDATNVSSWVGNVNDRVALTGERADQVRTKTIEKARGDGLSGRMLSDKVHAIAFWFLIVALFGACAGIALAFKYHSSQLDKTVQIGSFVHKDVVYEVKPRGAK